MYGSTVPCANCKEASAVIESLLARGMAGQASRAAQEAFAADPKCAHAAALSARAMIHAGLGAKAMARARAWKKKRPKTAVFWAIEGDCLAGLGRAAEAVKSYRQAAALEPAPAVFNAISSLLAGLGRMGEAAEAAKRACEMDPHSLTLSTNAAAILGESHMHGESALHWNNAARLDPQNEDTYLDGIASLVAERRDEEAHQLAESMVAALPGNLRALPSRAITLSYLGRAKEGYADVLAAKELDTSGYLDAYPSRAPADPEKARRLVADAHFRLVLGI